MPRPKKCRRICALPRCSRFGPLDGAAEGSVALALEELEGALPAQPREDLELLEQVLALPAKYRLPLYLYYYEGYSVEEVGRLIGRKSSTVQTQLARGRERLKNLLKEEGYYG